MLQLLHVHTCNSTGPLISVEVASWCFWGARGIVPVFLFSQKVQCSKPLTRDLVQAATQPNLAMLASQHMPHSSKLKNNIVTLLGKAIT